MGPNRAGGIGSAWVAALALGLIGPGWHATTARAGVVLNDPGLGSLPQGIAELERANVNFREKKYDRAFEDLQAACKAHPDLPPARYMMGLLFYAANQPDRGRPLLEEAAREAPNHPDIYLAFGKLALAEGRITDATLQFREALAKLQVGTWPAEQVRATRRIGLEGLATAAAARRDWAEAEKHLVASLAIEPKDGKLRQRLARAQFYQGRRDEAAEQLKKAVAEDAALEPAAVTMATLYAQEGNSEKAGEWMDYAVRVGPKDPRTHLALAGWLLEQGQYAPSEAAAAEAVRLDPKATEPRRVQGMAARLKGDLAASERLLQSVLQESPGDFFASNQLALALIEQPDEAKRRRAVEMAEINARQYPQGRDALSTLGWVYFKAGRAEEAERVLKAAVADGRSDSLTAYYLGRLLADLGRQEEARKLVAAAVEAPGPFSRREEARLWLSRLAPASPAPKP